MSQVGRVLPGDGWWKVEDVEPLWLEGLRRERMLADKREAAKMGTEPDTPERFYWCERFREQW